MKKTIMLFLIMTMLLSAGCGKTAPQGENTSDLSSPETTSENTSPEDKASENNDSENNSAGIPAGEGENAAAEGSTAESAAQESSADSTAPEESTAESAAENTPAQGEDSPELTPDNAWVLSSVGMTIRMPASYLANRDKVFIHPSAETISGSDGTRISIVRFFLFPAAEEALNLMNESEYDAITNGIEILSVVAGMPDGKGADVLNAVLEEYGVNWNASFSEPLGNAGNYTYYECFMPSLVTQSPEPGEELVPVYDSIQKEMKDCIGKAVFSDNVGTVTFSTTDLEGNPVDSAELFAGHKVTMINLWTSWCTYCIREMPELEEIYQEYKEKGCNVVGILMDADDPGAMDEALAILEQTGVTYMTLKPTGDILDQIPAQAYPTTYFVDENGKLIGETVVGADVDRYREQLENLR